LFCFYFADHPPRFLARLIIFETCSLLILDFPHLASWTAGAELEAEEREVEVGIGAEAKAEAELEAEDSAGIEVRAETGESKSQSKLFSSAMSLENNSRSGIEHSVGKQSSSSQGLREEDEIESSEGAIPTPALRLGRETELLKSPRALERFPALSIQFRLVSSNSPSYKESTCI